MWFIETPVFTREIEKLLSAEEYRLLQLALCFVPSRVPSFRAPVGSGNCDGC